MGGTLPDGRAFAGLREFKAILLKDPEAVATGLAKKLFTYALGRPPDFSDRRQVAAIVQRSQVKDYGLRTLLQELAASETFVRR